MIYDECLRSPYLNWKSWFIFFVSSAITFALKKYVKTAFAIVSGCFGMMLAVSRTYLFYELNCVELIGL